MRTHFSRLCLPLLVVAALASSGCSSSLPVVGRGGGSVTVTLTGTPDCNNCRTRTASSLKVRAFQVADSSAIRTVLNNRALGWSKQIEAAAANVLGKPVEDYVGPNITKTLTVVRDPKAVAVVIEGNFCEKTDATWYFIHPARNGSVTLRAGSTGFTFTRK